MKRVIDRIATVLESDEMGRPAPTPVHRLRELLVALSLGNLIFVSAWFSSLFDADFGYFNWAPVNRATLTAYLVNILGFTLIFWGLMQVRRHSRGVFRFLLHVGFMLAVLIPLDFVRTTVLHIPDYQVLVFFKKPLVLIPSLVILALLLWKHEWSIKGFAVFVGVLSPLALLILIKITLMLLGLTHLHQYTDTVTLPAPGPVLEGQPRVVWIIFDETDQRLTFEQTPPGVELPEFHRLRGDAIYSTAAYPPGDATMMSMPALISGRRVTEAKPVGSCDLELTMADSGANISWRQLPSVFGDARAAGFNTALEGWYHPYDRILGSNLNYCVWFPFPTFEPARSAKFLSALRKQISCVAWTLHVRSQFGDLLTSSRAEAIALATNTTYRLELLHLPPPHKPGVYLPDQDKFTIFGMSKAQGYFNNLILADHWLGDIRKAMERSGEWDKDWIILSADHSWRESTLHDGKRDLRVPYLVKPPQTLVGSGVTLTNQFNTIITHDLILAILHGDVTNVQDTLGWVQAHASADQPLKGQRKQE